MMDDLLEPTADPAWLLHADGYDALRETSIASRFAVSNGFLGVRDARTMTRGADWGVPRHSYVAGLFDAPSAQVAPGLVPASGWLQVRILLPGGPLVRHPSDAESHRMTLDLRRGALLSRFRVRAAGANARKLCLYVRKLQLVSLDDRALGLQLIQVRIDEGDVPITIEASIENLDFGLVTEHMDLSLGVWHTHTSGKRLAIASTISAHADRQPIVPVAKGALQSAWTWQCHPGQLITFRHTIAVVRSDSMDLDPAVQARDTLGRATHIGWRAVLAAHTSAWSERWQCSDVAIDGDAAAQTALRFAVYHLNSAANPHDARVSIGARALTGDDYRGHVFWDTEIYLLPFYTLTWPQAARSLLMYRFHTLDGARAKAARLGWRGALYAWESADTGAETTPEQVIGPDRQVIDILCGRQEQHISADVAYAVWQYWLATADEAFMCEAGAEILLETGRFWASRAVMEADGHGHIRGVIGPDEYHETIDDNAFTNVMARWNIRRALQVADMLRARWPARWESLSAELKLDAGELQQWSDTADTIATGLDPKTGLFEQFEGYFKLEEIDLSHYAGRSVPMDVVLGRERIVRSKVVKQADVVALLALLPEEFSGDAGLKNFQYYEPRCSHGSSLSRAMHGLAAARLGLIGRARDFLRDVAAIDLCDTHVTSDGGIHIAALGGNWQTAVFGFGGLSVTAEGLALNPQLPPDWNSLAFTVQWQGRSVNIHIGKAGKSIEATLQRGPTMTLVVRGKAQRLDVIA
jgi:trehalose/maltose hydrolase-like predicted phosphorylase